MMPSNMQTRKKRLKFFKSARKFYESKKEIVKTPEYRRNMLQRGCVFLQLSTDTLWKMN